MRSKQDLNETGFSVTAHVIWFYYVSEELSTELICYSKSNVGKLAAREKWNYFKFNPLIIKAKMNFGKAKS